MKRQNLVYLLMMVFLMASQVAEARRDKRQGINFGTTLRLLDSTDTINGQANEDASASTPDVTRETSIQAMSPYLAYVMAEHFNLGLSALFETEKINELSISQDKKMELEGKRVSSTQAMSVFARFLFARVMYFEAGAGLYNRTSHVETRQTQLNTEGQTFTGEKTEYAIKEFGPGYHLGGGIEISVSNGFFFTASYLYRRIEFRQNKQDGSISSTRSKLSRRELSFGLSHYVN